MLNELKTIWYKVYSWMYGGKIFSQPAKDTPTIFLNINNIDKSKVSDMYKLVYDIYWIDVFYLDIVQYIESLSVFIYAIENNSYFDMKYMASKTNTVSIRSFFISNDSDKSIYELLDEFLTITKKFIIIYNNIDNLGEHTPNNRNKYLLEKLVFNLEYLIFEISVCIPLKK